jgi:glutathione S-transferase
MHEPGFVAMNPSEQEPVRVHEENVITESTVMNEYIDDVFPNTALRRGDPVWRARTRIWSKYVDEYSCPVFGMIGRHVMVRRIVQGLDRQDGGDSGQIHLAGRG